MGVVTVVVGLMSLTAMGYLAALLLGGDGR